MDQKREELIQLDNEKKKLEKRITELTDFLTQPGMPGIDGSLIDKDGFPKAGLDLVAIRTARHELICTQNDHKNLMEVIEKKMTSYFEELSNSQPAEKEEEENNNNKINIREEKPADALGEEPNNNNKKDKNKESLKEEKIREPFAKIVSVAPGSPADEAGLKPDDAIICFNKFLCKGSSNNPLVTLSEIVKSKIGEEIPISLVRKNENNILEIIDLNIRPHTWEGRGVLGCKFYIV